MKDEFPGPMTMIKIDGARIKKLREQQGLTQLYLATAVEVTTDTISRWENKRYPSIKKENGLKLAEALGVLLEELLENESQEDDQLLNVESPVVQHTYSDKLTKKRFHHRLKKIWPLLILSCTIMGVSMAFAYYYFYHIVTTGFSADRLLPQHCTKGQPFPVLIHVVGNNSKSIALILKETIPKGSTVHATSPLVSPNNIKNSQIKWLGKIQGDADFGFMISVNEHNGAFANFTGTAAVRSELLSEIGGDTGLKVDNHHWADSNADNMISDNEILMVYDYYSDIPGLNLDIDLIEEIWMGSGYSWDTNNARYKILE